MGAVAPKTKRNRILSGRNVGFMGCVKTVS